MSEQDLQYVTKAKSDANIWMLRQELRQTPRVHNAKYLRPGKNVISTAVANANDGDIYILGVGTFEETAVIQIPENVNHIAIIGQGQGITTIECNHDGDGIASEAFTGDTYRLHKGLFSGFTLTKTGSPGTSRAINLFGHSYNGLQNPNIIIRDVSIERTDDTHYWKNGIKLVNSFKPHIENVAFRGRSHVTGLDSNGIILESCVNGNVINCDIFETDIALWFEKASDSEIYGANKHGCEGCNVYGTNINFANYLVYLSEKAINISVHDLDSFGWYENAILETSDSLGYHKIEGGWLDFIDNSPGVAKNAIHLRKPGTSIIGTIICGNGDPDVRGIVLDTSCSHERIQGVLIRSCKIGIYLSACDKSSVIGNTFESTSGAYDILLASGSDYNTVIGNIGDKSITDNGANNQVANNATY